VIAGHIHQFLGQSFQTHQFGDLLQKKKPSVSVEDVEASKIRFSFHSLLSLQAAAIW